MNSFSIGLILVSVTLSVFAQLFLKFGMTQVNAEESFNTSILIGVFNTLTNLYVIAGLFAYVSSAAVWLAVLSRIEVSRAYPFVGLGFIGTMLFAYWFLDEPLSLTKVIGTCLIVAGVLIISR